MNFFDNDFDYKNKYNELINRVAKYDVFDFISKISSLNLIPNNQNKNNVLAEFIDVILSKDISFTHQTQSYHIANSSRLLLSFLQ